MIMVLLLHVIKNIYKMESNNVLSLYSKEFTTTKVSMATH